MYAILHPTGQISLRTLHANPIITINRIEEDHLTEWPDLQSQGYRLVTLSLSIAKVHENAYTAIYDYNRTHGGRSWGQDATTA